MKNDKITGPDEVSSDILKCIDVAHINIVAMLNNMYKSGTTARKWLTQFSKKSKCQRMQ